MHLRWTVIFAITASRLTMGAPVGNQAEINRPVLAEAWKHRIDLNGGVHAWNRTNDGMRVFQEWIALLTKARLGTPEIRLKTGLALEKYVVGGDIGPLGFIGTSLPVPGYDQGDFDMSLLGCSTLLELFLDDKLLLTDRTLVHLIQRVVRTWGQTPKAYFDILFVSVPETENHLFMTESTRYLTNQILWENSRQLPKLAALRDSLVRDGEIIDNSQGMLKRLLLKVMYQAMCKGFFEFNAQVYQRFTIHALDNLYSFAHDRSIQDGSGCVLDYLSAVFAFQSIGSLRYGPYRRSSEVYQDSTLIGRDAACSFFAVQSGVFPWDAASRGEFWRTHTAHASMALYSTVLKYRVPDPILDFMQWRPDEYRAEIRSGYAGNGSRRSPTEIYYGGRNFLVSAGGRFETYSGPNFPMYQRWFGSAPWVYDVITRSSSLLLDPVKEKPGSVFDILHFKGSQWRSNNLAIHKGFLYGYSKVDAYNSSEWPQHIPVKWSHNHTGSDSYLTRDFEFQFLDRSTSGVYIVLSRLRTSSTFFRWAYQKYLRGTIEVVDTAKVTSLTALRDSVLFLNKAKPRWPLGPGRYVYVNIEGDQIHLNSRYTEDNEGIVRVEVAPRKLDAAVSDIRLPFSFPWVGNPHFQVDLFSPWKGKAAWSDGQGNMYVFNPTTAGWVISDFREWWNPHRVLSGTAPAGIGVTSNQGGG